MNVFLFVLPAEKLSSQHLYAAAKALAELGAAMESKQQHQLQGASLELIEEQSETEDDALEAEAPQEVVDYLNRCLDLDQQ